MQMVGGAGDRAAIRARREHLLGGVSEMSFPFSEGARPTQGDEERDGGAGFGRGWRGWGRGGENDNPINWRFGDPKMPRRRLVAAERGPPATCGRAGAP